MLKIKNRGKEFELVHDYSDDRNRDIQIIYLIFGRKVIGRGIVELLFFKAWGLNKAGVCEVENFDAFSLAADTWEDIKRFAEVESKKTTLARA